MRSTTCDKCKVTTTERNPKACGWVERAVEGHSYIDLCPDCAKEFDKVKDSAWNAFNATLRAWLGCVTVEQSKPMCKAKDEAICEQMTADGHCNSSFLCPNKEVNNEV